VLVICGFLPWINAADGTSFSGISVGDGWIVIGAGLLSAILGFIGLSRDSISLAAGQALLGLIALGFAIVNMTGLASGESAAFGLILTLVVALIVVGLGVYNAIDARRKGAKY
jgi:predicted transporter